jgi:hypothetical protein
MHLFRVDIPVIVNNNYKLTICAVIGGSMRSRVHGSAAPTSFGDLPGPHRGLVGHGASIAPAHLPHASRGHPAEPPADARLHERSARRPAAERGVLALHPPSPRQGPDRGALQQSVSWINPRTNPSYLDQISSYNFNILNYSPRQLILLFFDSLSGIHIDLQLRSLHTWQPADPSNSLSFYLSSFPHSRRHGANSSNGSSVTCHENRVNAGQRGEWLRSFRRRRGLDRGSTYRRRNRGVGRWRITTCASCECGCGTAC